MLWANPPDYLSSPHPIEAAAYSWTRRGRFRDVTCAQLANELAEAADDFHLSKDRCPIRPLRYPRVDDLGYGHLDQRAPELLFRIFTACEEGASVGIASNSPFRSGQDEASVILGVAPSAVHPPATHEQWWATPHPVTSPLPGDRLGRHVAPTSYRYSRSSSQRAGGVLGSHSQ